LTLSLYGKTTEATTQSRRPDPNPNRKLITIGAESDKKK